MAAGYRSSGPAPSRSEERVRRNEPVVSTTTIDLSKLNGEVKALKSDENWHSVARLVFDSLQESAQVVFWEPSDWAVAYWLCTMLDRDLKPQFAGMQTDADGATNPYVSVMPMKGASIAAYTKGFTNLLMTEVDRRRAGIEIVRATQLGVVEEAATEDNVLSFAEARERSAGN